MDSRSVARHGWWIGFLLAAGLVMPAAAQTGDDWPVPRHAAFKLDPAASQVQLSLFTGGVQANLKGSIKLFLGDPKVPVPATLQAGWVGLSVEAADLTAVSNAADTIARAPLHLILDPKVPSIGLWNTITYDVRFQLYLVTPSGPLPVPQPVYLTGFLATYTDASTVPVLSVTGTNGNIPDAQMKLTIRAYEVPPPPRPDIWFSTATGFHSTTLNPAGATTVRVSDGDLLSRRGRIVRRNRDLMGKLGIMPPVPDLGLDAAMLGSKGEVWFSFKENNVPIWSETLGVWLKHGDLLSETGQVVRTNERLLANFVPVPVATNGKKWDAGLDAVAQLADRSFVFSTNARFFSKKLNAWVGHGDLLSDRGQIVLRNRDLLRNFKPLDPTAGPLGRDYGLDTVVLQSNTETWFSTTIGFQDARLGPISDGDLLSTAGYIVTRNRDLLAAFSPIEDLANFGLDAAVLVVPSTSSDTLEMHDEAGAAEDAAVAQPAQEAVAGAAAGGAPAAD